LYFLSTYFGFGLNDPLAAIAVIDRRKLNFSYGLKAANVFDHETETIRLTTP
jgi:hypothetical protein